MSRPSFNRRGFMGTAAAAFSLYGWSQYTRGAERSENDERPPVLEPRATSGDDAVEPDWEERLTMTVSPKQGDLVGASERVIQAAIDYVSGFGGGTVKILPGTYKLRNSVFLKSGVRILGSGLDSILIKEPSHTTKLAVDSDWYDQEVTLEDDKGFKLGDGVCLITKNPHNGSMQYLKRTLVARSGKRFKLDKPLRENYWQMGNSTANALFPLLTGEEIENVVIENVALDGNRNENEHLDGNYAGCIFLQDCRRINMREVTARNYNGDGISWQICHDVVVENCHSHDNADLGLHPGSGSQRPLIRGNTLERNNIGIFFCWGVKYGLAENNIADGNKYGVSIGHRDTNNLIRENDIINSGEVGVLFRPERGKAFAPHRNRLEKNRIVNSGPESGIAVDIQGETESVIIAENVIKETRDPMQRVGIRVGKETRDIKLVDNTFEGLSVQVTGP
ncbi:MAG: right-handed parallel beta-helix repeat-containing protein [Planctomycetota bacterium]|nr:right-handed parallel beta-helix repeat-containing protein [Planctomycetota bacterium]MDA1214167.1 right-handed parallel beta-helix repeat-containing protein [Planctomycetota bacterium]